MNEIQTRLLKGARKLVEFWRSGQRCETSGWSLRGCTCEIKTTFCGAKDLWVSLMIQDPKLEERGKPNEESDYGVVEMMRATEFELSGLTVKNNGEKLHGSRIGPKGEISIAELIKLMDDSDAVPATLKLKEIFPGAEIETAEEIPEDMVSKPKEELV